MSILYKAAIVRRPAKSSVNGLTSVDLGKADYVQLLEQYENYTGTLAGLGLKVIELEALEDFPDSYFTEDTAIVTPEVAVVMRPGAKARRGETAYITDELGKHRKLEFISEPGTIDGGDVLIVNDHCIIGISERTNQQGAKQLCKILAGYGYKCDIVDVPEALHFKSSVNFVDEHTLLVTQTCYWLDCLSSYRKLVVQEGEEYSANVVWINGTILIPAGFPGTRRLLEENSIRTVEMPVSEISKMDGGLTCLSLRLT
jgi:dimethylargininase